MASEQAPVVLELAPLPREQIGPFFLLGVDKSAAAEAIEAHWAERVKWARKNLISISLEDINWARQVIQDPDKRVRADAASLNADTVDQVLRQLAERYGATSESGPSWQPIDVEKPIDDYAPRVDLPDIEALHNALVLPDVPRDIHAVQLLLDQLVRQPIDPWALNLPSEDPATKDPAP